MTLKCCGSACLYYFLVHVSQSRLKRWRETSSFVHLLFPLTNKPLLIPYAVTGMTVDSKTDKAPDLTLMPTIEWRRENSITLRDLLLAGNTAKSCNLGLTWGHGFLCEFTLVDQRPLSSHWRLYNNDVLRILPSANIKWERIKKTNGSGKQFWLNSLEKQFYPLKESSGSLLVTRFGEASRPSSLCQDGPALPLAVLLPEIITATRQTMAGDDVFSRHTATPDQLR